MRFDRHIGSFGGEAPISYLAWSRYADDLGLIGAERDTFHNLLTAIDAEYLDWREASDKAKG